MGKKIFTFQEAFEESVKFFNGDTLAASVWVDKYALKNSKGEIFEKSPNDMHKRLAKELYRIESKYPNPISLEEIYHCIAGFKYLVPAGSPMTGIGNDLQVSSISNCFVAGNEADSYGGILKTDEQLVQLMKRRGGVGTDLSHIRPENAPVHNAALTSSGVVSFMDRFSNSTREVAQSGRRGALMLSISITHPDSEKFIDAKLEDGKVTGANISVKITDKFMECVNKNKDFIHVFPVNHKLTAEQEDIVRKSKIGETISFGEGIFAKRNNAKKLWGKIIHNAWKSAEPGILYWDTVIRESLSDCYSDLGFKTTSTNPCGEIPLPPLDSCRLLAINLYSYVVNPFTKDAYFDITLFREHVRIAQRMMDNIVDLELEKVAAIINKVEQDPEDGHIKRNELELWKGVYDMGKRGRRTGLGITAEGDMLAALNLRYGTKDATKFSEFVHKALAIEAYKSSAIMAKERGVFEMYDAEREVGNPFLNRLKDESKDLELAINKYGRRNIACLTIAPTGTTSLMTQTTSGIEPVFLPVYKRRRKVDKDSENVAFVDVNGDAFEEYVVFHHKFKKWMVINGHDINKNYSDNEIEELVAQSPYYKATANDVDWLEKVRMQGRIQKWVDHSISVTVNLPNNVDERLVSDVYKTAWSSGCKGCTIYRDGSRDGVLVSTNSDGSGKDGDGYKRPKKLNAEIIRFQNNKEKWVAFIGLKGGLPYEIFTGRASEIDVPHNIKNGFIVKCKESGVTVYNFEYVNNGKVVTMNGLSKRFHPEYWNYAKLISGMLRHGMPIQYAIKTISSLTEEKESINSWKNGVSRALKRFVKDGTDAGATCESCGGNLVYQEGCLICVSCGASRCG